MAGNEVEKVGVDNVDNTGDGGQQPDTQETQTDTHDSTQDVTHDGAQDASNNAARPSAITEPTGEPAGTEAGDDKKKKKDNGKVDFPIADAKYRDKDGNVVTAALVDAGEGKDGADVVKLIAVPCPIFDEDGEVDETTGKKPVLYAGWNHRKHNPLKKGDFVNEADFVNYQAFTFRIKAAVFMEKAKVAEKRAAHLKKFGNDQHRKDVNRALKMREALAKFEKMLKEEKGIDIDAIDD